MQPGRPFSDRRKVCWMTLPCPAGQGALRMGTDDAACLRQGRCDVGHAQFWRVTGWKEFPNGLPIRQGWRARRDTLFAEQCHALLWECGVGASGKRGDGFRGFCRRAWRAPHNTLLPVILPLGERRTPPAPAQGTSPLRIPFAAAQLAGHYTPPVTNRRRRTAPARGPFAVYTLCHPNETRRSAPAPCSWGGRASL